MTQFEGKDFHYDIGTHVEKFTGDYQCKGTVCGYAVTSRGLGRYIVEISPGLLHIYSSKQLRRAE